MEIDEKIKDMDLEWKEINKKLVKYKSKNRLDFSNIEKIKRELFEVKDVKKCIRLNIFDCPPWRRLNYQSFLKTEKYKELISKFTKEANEEIDTYIKNLDKELSELKEKINYTSFEEENKKKNDLNRKIHNLHIRKDYLEEKMFGIPQNLFLI